MKATIKVLKEQFKYFYLVRRLSVYELRSKNNDNYLGMAWEIINPVFQISIYWFVFGYGIRQREDIPLTENLSVPFIYWMIIGMIVWLFFYQSIIQGSKSIYTRIKMLAKMNFPMSIIPNYVVLSRYFVFLGMFVILILVMNMSGYYVNIYYLQFPYYLLALFVFTFSLAFVMSTLSTIIRDIQMFLQSILRMGLYISPILWNVDTIANETISLVMKLNPLYYLIEGFRFSFFGIGWHIFNDPIYTVYFWSITIILFTFGSVLHLKFRRHFIDFV
ncbi:teichoic acid translocation permease protein TagG [Halolactibacillus alkaliphilus]|uniref:Transport permease protein n=1 Tax=Halolactibacillus alkaliphilus TaxID=442899 RepID=A0A511X544_9BACI|nr:ABC transporter permease [Halolactibacillus alkaliphilus]GEN58053.1 teichoic acid translocation permease protein TagG [Halolactibacillus alkaliphilus]GGN76305.1 teichoic acid translocation permease protein TagG [Halolactibacillus alkaliphilus]SFP13403.1 teichoic acid transport system permease protein [Halolactibacillus alkaliphilus]